MENNKPPFVAPEWIETLITECEQEASMEAHWPTLLLQGRARRLVWNICSLLGVGGKGVPGSACRLLERYLSTQIRLYVRQTRDAEEWARFKSILEARYYLLVASCIQLAAKMNDLLTPVSASLVRLTLLRKGIDHSNFEYVCTEIHVFTILGFRIPMWTSLEIAEYLAVQVGMEDPMILQAVGLVINITEFHRDELELLMMTINVNRDSPSSSSTSRVLSARLNLHVAASAVSAAARYMHAPAPDVTRRLATLVRTQYSAIKSMADVILLHILPQEKTTKRTNFKKRRLE